MLPDWLTAPLAQARTLPPAEALAHLFTHVHNEIVHGSGATSPTAVSQALVDNSDEIGDAVLSPPEPVVEAEPQPANGDDPSLTPPAPGSEPQAQA